MQETPGDLIDLQRLLDQSYASAGPHLASIITPARRMHAAELAGVLVGVRHLAVATTTRDCRPMVAPVDSIFYRGAFYFGTAVEAVRTRQLRARPAVSATHFEGDVFAATVHGTARLIDHLDASQQAFRDALIATYTPRYGDSFQQFISHGVVYFRIEAQRMFTFASRSG